MNNASIIFNRDILNRYLDNFYIEDVEGYHQKHAVMLKWKQSVEEKRFHKTKESEIQGRFLSSIFEEVLGYEAIENSSEWNQKAEYKSVLDSSQADCGLGFFTNDIKIVRAVVELKDANTDLDKKQHRSNHLTPIEQAFQYAHKNGSGCGWVIVSNFVEIRLYKSSSSLEYEQFFITKLDDETEFKRFYFFLCKENLITKEGKSLIDKLYDDNELARTKISNQFYNDYKSLRSDLFESLKVNNADIDELILFSKAQKILDRFIFICFCENRTLLPQGVFKNVIQAARSSFVISYEGGPQNRLWEQLRGLFHSIDIGNPPMNINGYNGGLFRRDEVLDELTIPDYVLENFQKLVDYDFSSELNVNILGHIFEYSISDTEQIKAAIEGKEVDRINGKQKIDGIFYTPDYVTKFIVEKTIGRWLAKEKEKIKEDLIGSTGYIATGGELGKRKVTIKKWMEIEEAINENASTNGNGKFHHVAVMNLHIAFWDKYTERLKEIKVLDPACGSGAFLNYAFDYLAEEGKYTVQMLESLRGGQAGLFDWDTHILQNNLYGVDLNIESVEITKLSLWLKTADNKKPLAYLDDNIKSGNSIINDPEIAGERAFDWQLEYPDILSKGGFDVVIGNPPYGARLNQGEKDYLATNYITTEGNFDTYKTFIEHGLKLTAPSGYMGYITPNTFFVLEKGAGKLRKFLFNNYTLLDAVELFNVFPTAVVEPIITIFKNTEPNEKDVLEVILIPRKTDFSSPFTIDGVKTFFMQKELRAREGYIFNYRATESEKMLRQKIEEYSKPLSEYLRVSNGMKPYEGGKGTPPQTRDVVNKKPFEGYVKIDDSWQPYVKGKTFHRYTDRWDGEYIKYGEWLAAPRNPDIFKSEKLFVRQTADYPIANFDVTGKICKDSVHCIHALEEDSGVSLKYVLGLINSSLMKWIYQYDNFQEVGKPLAQVKKVYVERLPISLSDDQQPVIALADALLVNYQARHNKARQFTAFINNRFELIKISEKLSNFYILDFPDFLAELKKQKAKLTTTQEMEMMSLFQDKVVEINEITQKIDRLEKELDKVVFEIYGLTNDEIELVMEPHI